MKNSKYHLLLVQIQTLNYIKMATIQKESSIILRSLKRDN